MFRQSFARLYSSFGQQRKLFLLVFLWTCLCLLVFRSSLFKQQQPAPDLLSSARAEKLHARSPASSMEPLYLAPEPGSPAASNNNALYYSLSSVSSSSSSAPALADVRAGNRSAGEAASAGKQTSSAISKEEQRNTDELLAGSKCRYDYPNLFDLQFNNIHWQKMSTKPILASNESTSATYYLYNAYYDDRRRQGLPSVRVLAMIDRIQPPPTNCLLWSTSLKLEGDSQRLKPLVVRATFVYAWYPKWGNYKDGLLQPWIVTCPIGRAHQSLVPDSVSLVEPPPEAGPRPKRHAPAEQQPASMAMPPSFSSSSPALSAAQQVAQVPSAKTGAPTTAALPEQQIEYDCKQTLPITNNLPVYNQRPAIKQKFAVCVKGLDFPHEDVSVRLVEWIELLNLLGAGKIFLYNLDVHENISKVLHYYQKRGIVELSPLTLPGVQPNLPEYQHLYLKSKLTSKRQNELIPYNDCLYRNLNSYQYLALLDIDEIIMPLKHQNWYDLMEEVERDSLAEQNYSRASYNVRNVYFFDDLAGPLGTTSSSSSSAKPSQDQLSSIDAPDQEDADGGESNNADEQQVDSVDSLERGIPHYLHMMQHVYRSKNYTKPGQYVKCFHNTERVVSLHNHFPMNCFGQCTTYSIPVNLAHLQHYRKDCVGPLKQSCKSDFRVFTQRDTTIWKYKQQMIRRTTRVLNHLGLLSSSPQKQQQQRKDQS